MKQTILSIKYEDRKSLAHIMWRVRVLTHTTHIQVLEFIKENQPCMVRDIHHGLQMEQSICSLNLQKLRQADLVIHKKRGRIVYYEVDAKKIEALINRLFDILKSESLIHKAAKELEEL